MERQIFKEISKVFSLYIRQFINEYGWTAQIKDPGSDNVLPDHCHRTVPRVMADEYEAMVEELLAGESRRNSEINLLQCYESQMKTSGLPSGDTPASESLRQIPLALYYSM